MRLIRVVAWLFIKNSSSPPVRRARQGKLGTSAGLTTCSTVNLYGEAGQLFSVGGSGNVKVRSGLKGRPAPHALVACSVGAMCSPGFAMTCRPGCWRPERTGSVRESCSTAPLQRMRPYAWRIRMTASCHSAGPLLAQCRQVDVMALQRLIRRPTRLVDHAVSSSNQLQPRSESDRLTTGKPVLVELKRPSGYEDVHAELIVEDAMNPDWPWQLLQDEGSAVVVSIDRPDGYERTSAAGVVKEAIRGTWPAWSVLKRANR